MSNDVNIEFKNSKELMKLFDELTEKEQKKVAVQAMRKSASIILNEAKSNFKSIKKGLSKTGYKNILFKSRGMKKKVGVVLGANDFKARFIDRGTAERQYITKNGKVHKTGKMEETRFFRNAVDSKSEEAQKVISDNLIISLERLVKKYNK